MSDKNYAETISVLEDGKLSVFLFSGEEVYIQPTTIVDTYDDNLSFIVRGADTHNVRVDTTVFEVDGVAFSGTFEALETALRELAKKSNGLFSGAAGGGGGTSDTTAANQVLGLANQDTQLSHSAKLLSGSTIDLTVDDNGEWIGFPFTMNGTNAIRIEDNESLEFVFNSIAVINKIEDLIEELQNKQSLLSFSKNTATSLLVNDGTKTVDSITLVELVNTGAGLVYDKAESAWGELTPLVLSAVQELNERSKTELANLKAISGKLDDILTKQPGTLESLRLSNPSNVIFTGFKALSFSCDGVNDSITVTQGGVPVTYPHANLDGSLIRGYEIPLNDVAYSNSITFNGTGTVDVFKID